LSRFARSFSSHLSSERACGATMASAGSCRTLCQEISLLFSMPIPRCSGMFRLLASMSVCLPACLPALNSTVFFRCLCALSLAIFHTIRSPPCSFMYVFRPRAQRAARSFRSLGFRGRAERRQVWRRESAAGACARFALCNVPCSYLLHFLQWFPSFFIILRPVPSSCFDVPSSTQCLSDLSRSTL
jgi:hypothetical protein